MTANDTIRIKYASKYAGSSNYWKNSMGMNEALTRLGVLPEKEALESRLAEWIKNNPAQGNKYEGTLATLKEAYTASDELARNTTYFLETFNNGIELIRFANTILRFDSDGTEEDKQAFINDRLVESYKNYDPALDKKVLPIVMKLYAERVPTEYHPDIYQKIDSLFGGDYTKYADWLFANSQFTSMEKLMELLKSADTEVLTKDPAMELALSTTDMDMSCQEDDAFYEQMLRGERVHGCTDGDG